MGVGNFEAEHAHPDPLARHGCLDGQRNLLRKGAEACVGSIVKIEDIVILHIPRNHESMALDERIDVEEGVEVLAFRHLV